MFFFLTDDFKDEKYDAMLTRDEKIQSLLKETLRPASTLITHVQICIVFWILGKSTHSGYFVLTLKLAKYTTRLFTFKVI
jgi:hypothetical protein